MAQNGKLNKKSLSRIYHPQYKVYLDKKAAAGWNTLRLLSRRYLRRELYPLGKDSAYRSYDRQKYYWDLYQSGKGNLAAYPGTSNHGWGKAIDLAQTGMRTIVNRFGKKFGWDKIEAPSEWWHINYVGGYNRPDPGISTKYPIARKGSGGRGQKWFVRKIQRRLRAHGHPLPNSGGEFNGLMHRRVKEFQADKKLKADGVVGEKTWKALLKTPIAGPEKPHKPSDSANKPNDTVEKPKPPAKPTKPRKSPGRVVDVSGHQGDIDWQKVANDKVKGVYLKLSEGQDWKDDSTNKTRLDAIKKAKLDYGFYHFLRPKKRDAALEARFFIKQAKELGGWGKYLPVADIEVTELDDKGTADYLARFIEVLRKEGGVDNVVIYASPGWWQGTVAQTAKLKKQLPHCKAWVAHWGVKVPQSLAGIKGYALHQFTDSGSVAGIKTNVDVNKSPDLARLKR